MFAEIYGACFPQSSQSTSHDRPLKRFPIWFSILKLEFDNPDSDLKIRFNGKYAPVSLKICFFWFVNSSRLEPYAVRF
ncbi:hypothetical protein L2E82_35573 [Cichorium intybus]|uniref:Uncharacterized protein n=1 Tax=Cichorium intybus TaxID=13427 RepID=A0ACB9BP58_CICIN|nr:hypothetical protein L2E82_35573 [Cichorium intybus]